MANRGGDTCLLETTWHGVQVSSANARPTVGSAPSVAGCAPALTASNAVRANAAANIVCRLTSSLLVRVGCRLFHNQARLRLCDKGRHSITFATGNGLVDLHQRDFSRIVAIW